MAKVKEARREIEKALKNATFVNASFGGLSKDGAETNKMIKAQTKLFRETWIIPNLLEAIVLIDPCKVCKAAKFGEKCTACNGWRMAGGLSFDPYELVRKSLE